MVDTPVQRWELAKNLLCVRLDSTGDVLMTSPALRALKDCGHGRRLTLLTSSSGAEAAKLVLQVDEVIPYDAPWVKATGGRNDPEVDLEMRRKLAWGGFDAAVIFTVFSQNPLPAALMCFLAGIPLRLAYCRENPYQLLTDWLPDPDVGSNLRHEVRRQLDLVASIGCTLADERIRLEIPQSAYSQVIQKLETKDLDFTRPWAVLHSGATAPSRRYEPEHFAKVARLLVEEQGWQLVFSGGAFEIPLVESIRARASAPSISLAGELTLQELSALIELSTLLISNNSGPAHIAAGVGTPVVDLYALTNPQHTPWMVPNRVLFHDVPCKFCYHSTCRELHHNCLRLVEPRQVVQAALELFQETSSGRRKFSSIEITKPTLEI